MPWGRLDDGLHDHPKFVGLPLAAVGVWTLCLSYALRRDDPAVPPGLPERFGASRDIAAALVAATLWETAGDGWVIHNFARYRKNGVRSNAFEGPFGTVQQSDAGRRSAAARRAKYGTAQPSRTAPNAPEPNAERRSSNPVPEPVPVPTAPSVAVARESDLFLDPPDDPDFAPAYVAAYRETHRGTDPPYPLSAAMVSAASSLVRSGTPQADVMAAVVRCARQNKGAGLLPLIVAEVQGGESSAVARVREQDAEQRAISERVVARLFEGRAMT